MADNLTNWQNATDNRFDFGKNAYLEAIPDLAQANAMAGGVAGMQAGISSGQADLAKNLNTRTDVFSGLQDQYAKDAFGYNSADRQNQVAGQAMADVSQKFSDTQGQAQRQMNRMGVNPSSGRSLAMSNQLGIANASAQAAAANKARMDLDNTADERQQKAIAMGANLPSQATNAAQMASYVGNSALTSAAQPYVNKLNFAGGISNIYGNAATGYGDLYKTLNLTPAQQVALNSSSQAASDQEDAAWLNAIGSVAGSSAGSSLIDKGIDLISGWF